MINEREYTTLRSDGCDSYERPKIYKVDIFFEVDSKKYKKTVDVDAGSSNSVTAIIWDDLKHEPPKLTVKHMLAEYYRNNVNVRHSSDVKTQVCECAGVENDADYRVKVDDITTLWNCDYDGDCVLPLAMLKHGTSPSIPEVIQDSQEAESVLHSIRGDLEKISYRMGSLTLSSDIKNFLPEGIIPNIESTRSEMQLLAEKIIKESPIDQSVTDKREVDLLTVKNAQRIED